MRIIAKIFNQIRRLPPYALGALIGLAIWSVAIVGAETLDQVESSFPKWMRDLDLIDFVGSICMIVAYPIAVGGWALVWGDNGPPYAWIENYAINVIAGIMLAVSIGAAIGCATQAIKLHRQA